MRVGEIHVDRKEAGVREIDDAFPVGAECGREIVVLFLAGTDQQPRARCGHGHLELAGHVFAIGGNLHAGRDRHGLRRLDQCPVPVGDGAVGGTMRHLLERALDVAGSSGRPQQRADDVVTIGAAQVGPERLAPAIREVFGILEIPEIGQVAAPHGIPHPHRRIGVDRAERHVFGHALDEP